MSPRVALVIGAIAAFVFGLLLVIAPSALLGGFGLAGASEAIVLSRDVGATLIGVGLINWMARDATGAALRAILAGNLAIQALELVVNGYEIASGALPGQAIGGLVLHAVLGGIFIAAMRRA